VGDSQLGRLASGGSTLHQAYNSSATSLLVDSSATPLWTTSATFPADFPFDIDVAGERMTVTAITGSSSPQTFTVTRSVNSVTKSQLSGAVINLWQPGVIGL